MIQGYNNPPSKPIIKGPTTGKPGIEYVYTFNSTDDEDDELSYSIDWGDGFEEVIGVFPPGTEAPASHTWAKKGTYIIKAFAEDQWGSMSGIGELIVKMPGNKIVTHTFLLKILRWLPNLSILLGKI